LSNFPSFSFLFRLVRVREKGFDFKQALEQGEGNKAITQSGDQENRLIYPAWFSPLERA
jgi:hypothetical protein